MVPPTRVLPNGRRAMTRPQKRVFVSSPTEASPPESSSNSPSKRRPGRRMKSALRADAVELRWPEKDLKLVATDDGDEVWVEPTDDRAGEIRLLEPAERVGDGAAGLLIRGDAGHGLRSLASLEPFCGRVVGQVRLCYIDPPFNTGEDFEHYDDTTGTPRWLGMLRERLIQIRELLAPSGSVWVHLDDSEQHRARCILDEVFGVEAFVATVIWQKRTSRDNRKSFSAMHDYIHVYAPAGPLAWKESRNALNDSGSFENPDNDPRGPWRSVPM